MRKFLAMLGAVSLLLTCVGCGMVNNGASESEIEKTPAEHPPIMQSPIARYFGSVHIDTDILVYDFQITQDPDPVIQITFKQYPKDTLFQTLSYQLEDDFMPVTVHDGLEIIDANNDGNDDFLFDLGIYGKLILKACLVYDPETKQYVFVKGFDELNNPTFVNGYFVTDSIPMEVPSTFDRYSLDGTTLCHVGRLAMFEYEPKSLYTEFEQVNGEWVTIKDMVPESDIDLAQWGIPSHPR